LNSPQVTQCSSLIVLDTAKWNPISGEKAKIVIRARRYSEIYKR